MKNNLKKLLKEYADAENISVTKAQERLAVSLDVSSMAVRNWCVEDAQISSKYFSGITDFLGLNGLDQLFDYEN